MKPIYQSIRAIANVMLMTLVFSGCTLMSGNQGYKEKIDIVTVSSDHAHLSRVMVTSNKSSLLISGEIHKKNDARGDIRGHIDIELISNNGTVLAIERTRSFRASPKSRVSQFSVEVPVIVSKVRKVLVTHHAPLEDN